MNLSASAFRMRVLSRHLFMVLVGWCAFGLLLSDSQGGSPATVGIVGTKDFGLDSSNRREVLAFYHTVYEASEGFEARSEWTGNVPGLSAGTTSAALKNDTLRRVNFYRALVGLPADITLNSEKSAKAQQAALIVARNGGLSHSPALEHPEWFGLTELFAGVEASAHSNLSLGAYGPAAVDGQMRDDGDSNWQAGHRRWLLSPLLAEIGAGDVPAQAGFPAANAIWVNGSFKSEAPAQFVAWPCKGYVPAPLLPRRWSLSYPGADFGSATVAMSGGGAPVAVRILSRSDSPADSFQGEKTLVWEPAIKPVSGREDVGYKVRVTGIRIGGELRDVEYTVVSFDPEVLGESVSIAGAGGVSGGGGSYAFNRIERADSYELTVFRGSVAPWIEGAEGPEVQVLAMTAPGYTPVQSRVVASGQNAFQLTHPGGGSEGFADQTLQLTRRLIPGPESVLQFSETGRFAETTTTLGAEVSADDGLNWATVWSRTGVGLNSAFFDRGWIPHAVSLQAYSGRAIKIRFNLKRNGGPVAAGTTEEHGFFIDNILVTNGVELVEPKMTVLSGTAAGFELNSATAGGPLRAGNSYYLSVAPRLGFHLFPASPVKVESVPVISAMAAAAPAVDPLVIRLQPVEVKVAEGAPAVFRVFATGGGSLGYQWRKNGVTIPGATGATYKIEGAQRSDDAGTATGYDVVITGGGGSVTSERVGLTVVVGGAQVIANPSGGSVRLKQPFILRVTTSEPNVTYQWRKNGVAIAGGTGATLALPSVEAVDTGRYDVALRTWAGEVVSSPAYVGLASKIVPNWLGATYEWGTLAGNGIPGSADGVGGSAQFNNPSSIAMDGGGNLYVADTNNHVIRRVTQTGVVTTVAGSAGTSGSADGPAKLTARFDSPAGIAVDKAGAVYVAESVNNTIRKLTNPTSSGNVTTIAGVAGQFGKAGGLNGPDKVAVDATGAVYFKDLTSIRKVDYPNQFSLLFGALLENFTEGQPTPLAMTVDGNGRILAAANVSGEFRVFSRVTGGSFAATSYGPYSFQITDLAVGPGGGLYAATEGTVQLLGDGSGGAAPGTYPVSLSPAADGNVSPRALTVDSDGTIFAVDAFAHSVVRGAPSGLPVFILQPVVATSSNRVLNAAAVGPGNVTFQWFRDGVAIPGATGFSYEAAAEEFETGAYSVEATNSAGTVASTVVSAGKGIPVLTGKTNASGIVGAPFEYRITATNAPTSYAASGLPPGLTLNPATGVISGALTTEGVFSATVGAVNASGAGSAPLEITVRMPAPVLTGTTKVSGIVGAPFEYRITATNAPTSYAASGLPPGLTLNPATGVISGALTTVGVFTGTVSAVNASGAGSAPLEITVRMPAPVLTGTTKVSGIVGELFTYRITATNTPTSYAASGLPPGLMLNTATGVISGALTTVGVFSGTVSAVNASGAGSAPLEITVLPLEIAKNPESLTVLAGRYVALQVSLRGPENMTIQWFRDGTAVVGGTSTSLTFSSVRGSDAGDYHVTVKSGTHSATSSTARLTVNVPASIVGQPEKEIGLAEGTKVFPELKVSAVGTPPIYYQWYLNNRAVSGGTGMSYAVAEVGDYTVKVGNSFGATVSEVSRVFFAKSPTILVQPKATDVNLGGRAIFNVSADGSEPLTYQWSKDGAQITGATLASFALEGVQARDAGLYDVLVSNKHGMIRSSRAQLGVNLPPRILSQPPASISATFGADVPLSVVVGGTGPFSYQWYQNDSMVSGGTGSTYLAPTLREGKSTYLVRVKSSFFAEEVLSSPTTVEVAGGRRISFLSSPASETNVIQGTAAVLLLRVDREPPDAQSTTYRLVSTSASGIVVSGVVPVGGELNVPLKGLEKSGLYKIFVSRKYKDGTEIESETQQFSINLRPFEAAVGTYELLLSDVSGLVGDGANYRGVLLVTVNRTGTVSGRILYTEAPPLEGAPGSERAYASVVRSFVSSLAPSAANPSLLECAPRLGFGTQANRQSLKVQLDFSAGTIELNATVTDRISVPNGECISQGIGAVRGMTSGDVSSGYASLVARYVLGSDTESSDPGGPKGDNNAAIFAQVLRTGRVLWTSRLSGVSGSGSATLSKSETDQVSARLYQGKTALGAVALSTTNLLGQITLERVAGGTLWNARVATEQGPDRLEKQSCYITKTGTPSVIRFDPNRFKADAARKTPLNWSLVRELDFKFGTSCRWAGSTPPSQADLLSFFNDESTVSPNSMAPLELTAVDPVLGGSYRWTILLSPTGAIKTVSELGPTAQPVLSLRLDKIRGEWVGFFMSLDRTTRYGLFGAAARLEEGGEDIRGSGWVENGVLPSTLTGFWKLKLAR